MTFGSPGQAELPPERDHNRCAGAKRVFNLALGHQIALRLALSSPAQAAELTAIRSAVEDHIEVAMAGVTAVDVEGGWTAEEALEQYGMQVAMDMMLEGLVPPAAISPTISDGGAL